MTLLVCQISKYNPLGIPKIKMVTLPPHSTIVLIPCYYKNVQRTLGGSVLGTFLWKVFFTFSECLCGLYPHWHQGIFTDNLTSSIFCKYTRFMQTIFNFIYFRLFNVLCQKCSTCKLPTPYEKPSQKVGTALPLWEPSENVL